MKYRDNMSAEEIAAFKEEIDALDVAYAAAQEHDARSQAQYPKDEEWEDQQEYWRKAGLDSRGCP